ncbi:MAG: hypothetical protein Q9163_003814 [Psora crenata]
MTSIWFFDVIGSLPSLVGHVPRFVREKSHFLYNGHQSYPPSFSLRTTMRRETLPSEQLSNWMRLNGVQLNGVAISPRSAGRGLGVVATRQLSSQEPILMTVPRHLVLSMENVWAYAKTDQHLLQVLEAVDDYSRVRRSPTCPAGNTIQGGLHYSLTDACQTARGAILIFLLLQLTHNATDSEIGTVNPFSQYVKHLPQHIPLPTFWNADETALLKGTSLEAALEAKLKSLNREFTLLRDRTLPIAWCRQHWWGTGSGRLTLDDWKYVDAAYRSRALDLPGTGHATVPCIDMANHASGDDTSALYETSTEGDAVLVVRDGKQVGMGGEITITYGDEKGASEMLFSYGFVEDDMRSARELYLDLDIPADDPLKLAKKASSKTAPGFRLYERGRSVDWDGSFVWLFCVNEEDGVQFKPLPSISGRDSEAAVEVFWKGLRIKSLAELRQRLEKDVMWDVFHLRAITTLQDRVEQQLLRLESGGSHGQAVGSIGGVRAESGACAMEVRDLEETMMLSAYEEYEHQKTELLHSPVVRQYLGEVQRDDPLGPEKEDF